MVGLSRRAMQSARREMIARDVARAVTFLNKSPLQPTSRELVDRLELETDPFALAKELGRHHEVCKAREHRNESGHPRRTRWQGAIWRTLPATDGQSRHLPPGSGTAA